MDKDRLIPMSTPDRFGSVNQDSVDIEVARQAPSSKRLSMWGLAFMTFFAVSGGPYGIEDAVRIGYPFYALLGIFIIPWIWSLSSALLTAELSTALPHNGGYVWWVNEAFGPFWAFQEAYWSFVNNLFDLAIYPVMFENYLVQLVPINQAMSYVVRYSVLVFCFSLNYFGVDIVSKLSGVFIVILLLPFLIMFALGVTKINVHDWFLKPQQPIEKLDWGLFLTTIVWNTGGFDNMSQVAGELDHPNTAYPRAMMIVLVAMIATYMLPILVGVSVATDYSKWTEGYFPEVAGMIGGEWLKTFTVIGACLKAVGVLTTYLCTCSQMMAAWGDPQLLGMEFLGRMSRYRTPWISLLINSILVALGMFFSFQFLIQLDQLFYALGLLLEYFALLYLRFSKPEMVRAFKIPLGNVALVIFCIIPMAFIAFTIVTPLFDWTLAVITVCTMLFGFVLHPLLPYIKHGLAAFIHRTYPCIYCFHGKPVEYH